MTAVPPRAAAQGKTFPFMNFQGNYSVLPYKQGFIALNGEWEMGNGE